MRPERFSLPLARPVRPVAIGLTPLIDVVFILLLFFMLASHLQREQTLPLRLGAPAHDTPAVESVIERPVARVALDASGALHLNGAAITEVALALALSEQQAREPQLQIQLLPSPGVKLQQLVGLLDRLAAAGIRGVTLE